MDRHIARTIVRNSAGDARVIWSIFSGYHPQELRESGGVTRDLIHSAWSAAHFDKPDWNLVLFLSF